MNDSSPEPEPEPEPEQRPPPDPSPDAFELPVAPGFHSQAPKGSFEDGWQLSLLALEAIKDRPEIFTRRSQHMVNAEFVM